MYPTVVPSDVAVKDRVSQFQSYASTLPDPAQAQIDKDLADYQQHVTQLGDPAASLPSEAASSPAGSTSSQPGAGDIAGWRNVITQQLGANANPDLVNAVLSGAYAESGLDPTRRQAGGNGRGFFQFDTGGGMGTGLSDAQLNDQAYQASKILPRYIDAWNRAPSNLTGADKAAWVAVQAERPDDSRGQASANYRAAYNRVVSNVGQSDQSGPGTAAAGVVSQGLPSTGASGGLAANANPSLGTDQTQQPPSPNDDLKAFSAYASSLGDPGGTSSFGSNSEDATSPIDQARAQNTPGTAAGPDFGAMARSALDAVMPASKPADQGFSLTPSTSSQTYNDMAGSPGGFSMPAFGTNPQDATSPIDQTRNVQGPSESPSPFTTDWPSVTVGPQPTQPMPQLLGGNQPLTDIGNQILQGQRDRGLALTYENTRTPGTRADQPAREQAATSGLMTKGFTSSQMKAQNERVQNMVIGATSAPEEVGAEAAGMRLIGHNYGDPVKVTQVEPAIAARFNVDQSGNLFHKVNGQQILWGDNGGLMSAGTRYAPKTFDEGAPASYRYPPPRDPSVSLSPTLGDIAQGRASLQGGREVSGFVTQPDGSLRNVETGQVLRSGQQSLFSHPAVGGAIVGGATGATQGNTPEERARNALLGATAGGVGGYLLGSGQLGRLASEDTGAIGRSINEARDVPSALDAAKAGWAQMSHLASQEGVDLSQHNIFLPIERDTIKSAPGTIQNAKDQIDLYNSYTSMVASELQNRIRPRIEELSAAIQGQKDVNLPDLSTWAKAFMTPQGYMKERVPLGLWMKVSGAANEPLPIALSKINGRVYVNPQLVMDKWFERGEESRAMFGKEFTHFNDFEAALGTEARRLAKEGESRIELQRLTALDQQASKVYKDAIPSQQALSNPGILEQGQGRGFTSEPPLTSTPAPDMFGRPPPSTASPVDNTPIFRQPEIPNATGEIPSAANPDARAGNILLRKYVDPEVQQVIADAAAKDPAAMEAARRGVVSDQTVQDLANAAGTTVNKVIARWKPGDVANAETITAMRSALQSKAQDVSDLAKTAVATPSAANDLNLALAIHEQDAIQKAVVGGTAELGRGLRALRSTVQDAIQSGDPLEMQKVLKRMGGGEWTADLAKKLAAIPPEDAQARYDFLRNAVRGNMKGNLTFVWYNFMLSGPHTVAVKTTSELLSLAASPFERAAAAAVDLPLSLTRGGGRQRFFGEAPADVVGMVGGIREGVAKGLYTMQHGYSMSDVLNSDYIRPRTTFNPKVEAVLGSPSRILAAGVDMMSSIAQAGAINAGAYRLAKIEGHTGQVLADRIAELRANPTPALAQYAKTEGAYRTFQTEPVRGSFMQRAGDLRSAEWHGIPVGRIIVPFWQTPINLMKQGLERSPMALLNPAMIKEAIAKDPKAADSIGRALLGSSVASAIALQVKVGNITGPGPTNPTEADAWRRQGKIPWAVKIGDKYYNYQKIPFISQSLGQVASIVDSINKGQDVGSAAGQLAATIGANMTTEPYMQGISTLMNALSNPTQFGERMTSGLATSVIPAGVRVIAQNMDPTVRQTSTVPEAMQADIPGLSQNLPPRLNAFGEPQNRLTSNISPIGVSQATNDPVDAELTKYGVEPGFTGKTMQGIDLTRQEQADHQRIAGQLVKQVLQQLIAEPQYQQANDIDKARALGYWINKAKDAAARRYLDQLVQSQGRDTLIQRIQQKKLQRLPKAG